MPDFIPKRYSKEPITIRISLEKLELIESLAVKSNMSRSEFINQCIDFAIKNMPDKDDNSK